MDILLAVLALTFFILAPAALLILFVISLLRYYEGEWQMRTGHKCGYHTAHPDLYLSDGFCPGCGCTTKPDEFTIVIVKEKWPWGWHYKIED